MSIFSHVKIRRNKRRNFNLGHEVKFTTDIGYLVPIYWNYFEPTAKFRMSTEIMCRVAPMLAPLMHRVNVYTAAYKVPMRLVYKDWESYITGGPDGTEKPIFPRFSVPSNLNHLVQTGSLADFLGVPYNGAGTYLFDSPAFTAYQLIWNTYFRDQNLQNEISLDSSMESGVHDISIGDYRNLLTMRRVCWEKDYFTSALPFAQRGEPVNIPVSGGDVAMEYVDNRFPFGTFIKPGGTDEDWSDQTLAAAQPLGKTGNINPSDAMLYLRNAQSTDQGSYVNVDNSRNLKGTVKSLNATINDLRTATRVQRWLERNAVGGARYIEQILAHFPGARNLDARLQRPEYIGGGRIPLVVSEVLQTSESTDASSQGTMAGRGVANGLGNAFTAIMDEHCIVMVMLWVRPKSSYQQGLPRKLQMADKFDFPWPEFGNLGEQPILNSELYYTPVGGDNDGTFGYQSRYAQYKYEPNRVHGDFKDTLNFWHMGRIFQSAPSLTDQFVSLQDTNLNRVFAVENDGVVAQDTNHFWFQIYNNIKCNRPLPYFGTPL